jgi:hypothetical protein
MRRISLVALSLLLSSAPLHAQVGRVAVDAVPITGMTGVDAAPAALTAPLSAPALLTSPLLAAPAASVSPFSVAAPVAAPVALAAAAPIAAPPVALTPVAAVPARAAALDRVVHPAAADGPASERGAAAAAALFDQSAPARPLSEIVDANSSRRLAGGVFIQQEHEGSLLQPDSRDSSGNVFRYYKPVEMRPELVAQTQSSMGPVSKFFFSVRSAFQFRGRGTPEAAWRAWPLTAKLDYLDRLEKAVIAERGPPAAWDGKVSLILERKDEAPAFVTKNPHMEAPPQAYSGSVGARFLQPEIVSAKETPAASVAEALGRAKTIIADTGHAGVQFHVFVKAEPKDLLAQIESLDGALQLVNDALYAKAAAGSDTNITHPSLLPWHAGRSARVRALLQNAGADAHVPAADDADSEKHAFVGFRYWGMEGGKAVVSLELRGASLPWKRVGSERQIKGFEEAPKLERDYTEARAYLTYLSLYAEALAQGRAPAVPGLPVVLDEKAADAYLAGRARELGMPDSAFDGLAAFSRRLLGAKSTPAGYLFPFGASAPDSVELKAFADEVVVLAAREKAAQDAGHLDNVAHDRYLFWSAYAEWANRFGARRAAQLGQLVRGLR